MKANKPDTFLALRKADFTLDWWDWNWPKTHTPVIHSLPFIKNHWKNTIMAEEIQQAIKSPKPHKRPCTYCFSTTYYKRFADFLIPSFRTESITASISMIPKPNTDNTAWSNYRPISILNLDIKRLAKVLSSHLNSIISSLVHNDQAGFIQPGDNIRRATLLAHEPALTIYHPASSL